MGEKLIAIAGPLHGQSFAIPPGRSSIGRGPQNWLVIEHPWLSRRHCEINATADGIAITDLSSRNGTFVNGERVQDRMLKAGDQVRLGDSVFLVAEPGMGTTEVVFGSSMSVEITPAETRYLAPIEAKPADTSTPASAWQALLQISNAIHSAGSVEVMAADLLRMVFNLIPAQTGSLLIGASHPGVFDYVHTAGGDPNYPVQPSRTVLDHVRRTGNAVLCNQIEGDAVTKEAHSLFARRVRSVMAVPLSSVGQTLGFLYLETSDPGVSFSRDHLELCAAIGLIAALAVENARRLEVLAEANDQLRAEHPLHHDMIGESAVMRAIYDRIARVAPTDSTVLIRGESGSGKELAARAVHRNSRRAQGPFIAVNCAALAESLLESELFGHEKGAFTGAIAQKKGKIEVAAGGTLFLDEIGELAPPLQAKLLRVLQEREFERVGGTRTLPADIRLVAATNVALEDAVKNGAFRQDLYFRLNVVAITMPPLRERREDIPLIAQFLVKRFAEKTKRTVIGLSPAARRHLMNYDWPGNVRELANVIEHAVVLGSSEMILPEDLPEALLDSAPPTDPEVPRIQRAVQDTKRAQILVALEESGGNVTEAARKLGTHPNYLHRLIRNLGLRDEINKRFA